MNCFDFLHDVRGQHSATSGLGVRFEKKLIQGFAGGVSVKKIRFFDIFSERLL